ncbi:hypothetical protein BDD12DRAFT_810527 [Trichophaea hybrida]|nr:hypothetical protein BDD12DRAFT_810527 [Trichophaea hybrida]
MCITASLIHPDAESEDCQDFRPTHLFAGFVGEGQPFIHPLLTLSGVIVAVTVFVPSFASAAPQEMLSPCSYPRLAASTVHSNCDGAPSTVDMQPTPTQELRMLRRQTSDSLGWNDPSTCNVGICDTFTSATCTVYSGHGLRAETVTGVCCAIGRICTPNSVGSSYPYCYSLYYQYGYGLGTFLSINCAAAFLRSTTRNPSWALYASELNPAKGPMPTMTPSSMETPSELVKTAPSSTAPTPPPPSLAVSAGKSNALPVGAIAGTIIGSIFAIALAVMAIMVILFKLRKANSNSQVMLQFQPKESKSPAQVYSGSAAQSSHMASATAARVDGILK